jgi:hypothetical protein
LPRVVATKERLATVSLMVRGSGIRQ